MTGSWMEKADKPVLKPTYPERNEKFTFSNRHRLTELETRNQALVSCV